VKLSDRFLDEGVIVSVRGRKRQDAYTWRASQNNTKFTDIPVVVLIDQGTASASEITSAALQENGRALLVGTSTFGKGAVQSVTSLQNGGALKLTTAMYHTPNDHPISRETPVEPDVTIEMSIERLRALRQKRVEAKLRGRETEGLDLLPEEEGTDGGNGDEGDTLKREEVTDIQLDGAVAILKAQLAAARSASLQTAEAAR
jgi:carboxyl-terminal processing protease